MKPGSVGWRLIAKKKKTHQTNWRRTIEEMVRWAPHSVTPYEIADWISRLGVKVTPGFVRTWLKRSQAVNVTGDYWK